MEGDNMGQAQPTGDDNSERELANLQRRFMRGELTAMEFEKAKWKIEGTYSESGPLFSGTNDAVRAVVPSGLPGTEPIRDTNAEPTNAVETVADGAGSGLVGGGGFGVILGVLLCAGYMAVCVFTAGAIGFAVSLVTTLIFGPFVVMFCTLLGGVVGGVGGTAFGLSRTGNRTKMGSKRRNASNVGEMIVGFIVIAAILLWIGGKVFGWE